MVSSNVQFRILLPYRKTESKNINDEPLNTIIIGINWPSMEKDTETTIIP
jgi:hypothetical protein